MIDGNFHGSKFTSISLAVSVVKIPGIETCERTLSEMSSSLLNLSVRALKSISAISTFMSRVPSIEISKVTINLPPGAIIL